MSVYCGECFGNGWNTSGSSSYSGSSKYANSYAMRRLSTDITNDYIYDIEKINKYSRMGEVDKALELQQSLFDKVRQTANDYNYTLSDGQIKSLLDNAYINITKGTISDNLTATTKSPFLTGLLQTVVPIGGFFTHTNSTNEVMAKLDNETPTEGTKSGEGWGRAVGIAAYAVPAIVTALCGHPIVAGICAGIGILSIFQSGYHSARDQA